MNLRTSDVFLGIMIFVIILTIIYGMAFGMGWVGNRYDEVIGGDQINVQRENFEQSKSRLHGLADDLAKYKYELATESDPIARRAMIELIIDRTSSLDVNDLEDESLKDFVTDIKNGEYE